MCLDYDSNGINGPPNAADCARGGGLDCSGNGSHKLKNQALFLFDF